MSDFVSWRKCLSCYFSNFVTLKKLLPRTFKWLYQGDKVIPTSFLVVLSSDKVFKLTTTTDFVTWKTTETAVLALSTLDKATKNAVKIPSIRNKIVLTNWHIEYIPWNVKTKREF